MKNNNTISKAKLTIIKDSKAHQILDDLKIPYRMRANKIYVSMNEQQFESFNQSLEKSPVF